MMSPLFSCRGPQHRPELLCGWILGDNRGDEIVLSSQGLFPLPPLCFPVFLAKTF